jgi:hypothetical protein
MLGIWVGVRQGDGGEKVSFLPISGLTGAKLKRKFTGFTGWRVSVELRFLKASFPEGFGCEKKVPLDGWVSLKVSFPVNSVRRKEVFCDGGALGVYKVRLKVDR